METKTPVPHKIIVIGGKEPLTPALTEAAKAAGIKPQPYYRLQLVPEAAIIEVNGKRVITGAGDGRTRSRALFSMNNSIYVDSIRQEIAAGNYKEYKTVVRGADGLDHEETALELTKLSIAGAWYVESCPEYYVTDRSGKPIVSIVRDTNGGYSKRNAVASTVAFFVFDGANPAVEYEAAVRRTAVGRLLLLADQKKAEAAAAAKSPIHDTEVPSADDLESPPAK
jgi:hypothetical protein